MATLTYTGALVIEKCWCGISHAIPKELANQAHERGTTVFCPLGHQWVVGRTVEQDLAEAKRDAEYYKTRLEAERSGHARTQRRLSATQGVVTRTKKRIAAGVCPCCHRTFAQLARHMAGQHPEYAAEDAS